MPRWPGCERHSGPTNPECEDRQAPIRAGVGSGSVCPGSQRDSGGGSDVCQSWIDKHGCMMNLLIVTLVVLGVAAFVAMAVTPLVVENS